MIKKKSNGRQKTTQKNIDENGPTVNRQEVSRSCSTIITLVVLHLFHIANQVIMVTVKV
jgi:hypothetical protein